MLKLRDALGIDLPSVEVLDIGAMAAGLDRYGPLVEQGLACVTGFEPNDAERGKLQGRPRHRYLPHVLGDGEKGTFHVTRFPGCTSLLEPDPSVIDLFEAIGASRGGNFEVLERVPVETTRLDDVTDLSPPDFVKIDVQGAALPVIANGARVLASALAVEIEVEFVPLYKGQALFGEIATFMERQGFVLHKFVDVNGRALRPFVPPKPIMPVSQALWADAIFVRSYWSLEKFSDEDLLKAALIFNDMYRSYDLAYRFLAEHDRRRHSLHAVKYLSAIKTTPGLRFHFMNVVTDL